jgi:hypothetical protein
MKTAMNAFGDLSEFQPERPAAKPEPSTSAVTAVAEEHGFTVNNFPLRTIPAQRRKLAGPPLVNKTYRIYVSDANKIQNWMNDKGFTQKEGFAILAKNLPSI